MQNPILQTMLKSQLKMSMNKIIQNPKFKEFVENNKGKTPEQIAKDYGLNWNDIEPLLK